MLSKTARITKLVSWPLLIIGCRCSENRKQVIIKKPAKRGSDAVALTQTENLIFDIARHHNM